MDHAYAEVNGIRLHYVTEGRGPLVLFVHGFPEFWYAWRSQLREFGRDHQAVALDMRGYNLSAKPADLAQYRVPHLVEDLRGLAAHLGHERFVLVGHDWGGVVAWAVAIAHPERLQRLVIINAPHPAIFDREIRENPAQQTASRYMLTFRSAEAEAILAANDCARLVEILGRDLGDRFTAADRAAYLEAWSQPGALTGGLNYYRAAGVGPPAGDGAPARSFGGDVARMTVRVPTLVIWGEQDRALLTGNLDGLERFVPDLTIERIPDGSHWVVHQHPERVNRLIRDFLGPRRAPVTKEAQ
ncbi:MAG TPA: alpha/beta hydrolase [Candidatus Binatia bacterium]|nr:alpha/beta hydrolase [Candidatus Binatia bacterium]